MAGRRGMRAMAVCLALGLLALGAAQAQGKAEFETTFSDHGVDCGFSPPDCLYSGQIDSAKEKCIRGRKVKMFRLLMSGKPQLVDTDKTTRNGNFVGLGLSSEVSAAKFKVLPKQIGDDTCQGKTFIGA